MLTFRRFGAIFIASVIVAAVSAAATPAAETVPGGDVLYTFDQDFDKGTLVNVNHEKVRDQLQLNDETSTFPFVWIALSARCTIAKINTDTGEILGEYSTISDEYTSNRGDDRLGGNGGNRRECRQSSRTTVGLDGSVWVGHRGPGGATHVGLAELNQCIDRNGNGTIETSTGYGDVKPWPGQIPVAEEAEDECIIHHVDTDAAPINFSDTRHMSIDADNNLWIGTFGGSRFIEVDGTTGEVISEEAADLDCGGYGGVIDGNGVIWSANGGSPGLLRWDPDAPESDSNPRCITQNAAGQSFGVYGVAVDSNGFIWITTFGQDIYKISPDGNTVQGPFKHNNPTGSAQGLAVAPNGDVWVGSALSCSSDAQGEDDPCTVSHLKNDGTFVGLVRNPTGDGSTGVAVDANGKVWTANINANTATRIDPGAGAIGADGATRIGAVDLTVDFPAGPGDLPLPNPYNYSDMTGSQLLANTAPQGSWTVTQDGGSAGFRWGFADWTQQVPAGSQVLVEVRAADTEAGLGSAAFVPVGDNQRFDVTGRFLQVRVTLRPGEGGVSPVLEDIRVCSAAGCQNPAPAQTSDTGGVAGATACASGRRLTITLRIQKELRRLLGARRASLKQVKSVTVRVNGKRVRVFKRGGRYRARVDLRGLARGRYAVNIRVQLKSGRELRGTRRYRTCTTPRRSGPPPL